jgi:predicted short-subunit dehydrogenase-like oxidoreductase (DUF2520 family)
MTGPVARGDARAVAANLEALPTTLADAYRALGTLAAKRLRRQGLLTEDQCQLLLATLTDCC